MLICNCTLSYTNPEACKGCSAYLKEDTGMYNDWNDWLKDWNKYTHSTTLTWNSDYDRDRYELVEKKDWKLNSLKKDIKTLEDLIIDDEKLLKEHQETSENYVRLIEYLKNKISGIEQQIKELEQ